MCGRGAGVVGASIINNTMINNKDWLAFLSLSITNGRSYSCKIYPIYSKPAVPRACTWVNVKGKVFLRF